ncbi:MAG: MmgE/PrpD family protein [Thermodesulfobacteriota bacterium]
MNQSVSQKISQYACDFRLQDVPGDVLLKAKSLMIDAIGLCFATADMQYSDIAYRVVSEIGGAPESTVIGKSRKIPAIWAVLLNGIQIHGHDYDDTHAGSVAHTEPVIVPIALAFGERNHLTGIQILEALVLGLEFDCRIGLASRGGFHKRGFHTTALAGTMGGVITAAKALNLDPARTCHAQGIVGSSAAGLREAYLSGGSWTKMLHPAWSAHSAAMAALLAQQGYTGTPTVYEGRFGLFKSHLYPGDGDYSALLDDLGERWEIRNIDFKPYPCGVINHAFIECACSLQKQHRIRPDEIKQITCFIHPDAAQTVCEPIPSKRRPESGYHAKFSLPFAVAAAMVDQEVTLKSFTDDKVGNPEILKVADRVEYQVDPDSAYPATYPGKLEIRLTDGRVFMHHQSHNKGSRKNPMTETEIKDKFYSNALHKITRAQADEIYHCIIRLENVKDSSILSTYLNY